VIRRLLWFTSGIGVGVYGSVRAAQAARKLAPDHVARRAAANARELALDVRAAVADGRDAMREREHQLEQELRGRPDAPGH
jgi:hypothetical protein